MRDYSPPPMWINKCNNQANCHNSNKWFWYHWYQNRVEDDDKLHSIYSHHHQSISWAGWIEELCDEELNHLLRQNVQRTWGSRLYGFLGRSMLSASITPPIFTLTNLSERLFINAIATNNTLHSKSTPSIFSTNRLNILRISRQHLGHNTWPWKSYNGLTSLHLSQRWPTAP